MNNTVEKNRHEITKKLAFDYWERRGRPIGSPEVDWIAAEQLLAKTQEHSGDEFSLCSLRLEPDERPYRSTSQRQ